MGRQIERIERKMQKQTHKYILSMLIATMLLLSMLPIVPVIAAPAIVLTPSIGSPGDKVLVSGTDFEPAVDVPVYWDLPKAANVLNTTDIGGSRAFNVYVNIPPAVYGSDHYIIVKGISAAFFVTPSLTLTPDTGLVGDTITAEGHGFAKEQDIILTWEATTLVTDPATVTTDVNGSFTCTFDVPDFGYGVYSVTATDEDSNSDTTDFTIGATITLDVVEGPSGTVVQVDGRGFTEDAGLDVTVGVRNGTGVPPTYVLIFAAEVADITCESDGTFSGEFVIPTLNVGTYKINASDAVGPGQWDNVTSGDVEFDVTGRTGITLEPVSGVPLSQVTLEGVNFTAIVDTEVDVIFIDPLTTPDRTVTVTGTFETNATGGIEPVTFIVPDHPDLPIRPEKYVVHVVDEYGLRANATFRIVRTRAFVDPEEGPSGALVDVWVEGLTGLSTYNVTIDGELFIGPQAKGSLTSVGKFADPSPSDNWVSIWVPTMDKGTYDITVMDKEGVTAVVAFEVTETTELILKPSSGPPNYNITMEANYFTADADLNIEIIIYNLTAGGEVDWEANLIAISPAVDAEEGFSIVGNFPQTNDTGFFRGSFLVPEDDAGDVVNLGDYWINATDENGLGVWELDFSIVSVTVEVSTVRSTYAQGEDVTFKVRSTFPSAGTIEVMDADGFNRTVEILEGLTTDTPKGDYQEIGADFFAYPKTSLSTDAPIGTWHWTADVSDSIRKGIFSVVETTAGVVLIERINELEEDLVQLSDAVGAVRTSLGGVSTDIGTVEGYVDELEADLAAVSASVSAVSAAASAAETAATGAKAAADAANATAQGISMAVYGAMALSLIAALAAIAAVLTLQRKVAG